MNIAMIGMVTVSQVTVAEAVVEDRFPGSETCVLKAAFVLILIGLFTGVWLAKKYATWKNPSLVKPPATRTTMTQMDGGVRTLPYEIHIVPPTAENTTSGKRARA
jgi:hypothetical protein